MTRRTKTEWCELIEEQRTSGLSAAEFCRRNSVNAKYFSVRKKQLGNSHANFVRVAAPAAKQVCASTQGITVRVVEFEIPCEAAGEALAIVMERLGR